MGAVVGVGQSRRGAAVAFGRRRERRALLVAQRLVVVVPVGLSNGVARAVKVQIPLPTTKATHGPAIGKVRSHDVIARVVLELVVTSGRSRTCVSIRVLQIDEERVRYAQPDHLVVQGLSVHGGQTVKVGACAGIFRLTSSLRVGHKVVVMIGADFCSLGNRRTNFGRVAIEAVAIRPAVVGHHSGAGIDAVGAPRIVGVHARAGVEQLTPVDERKLATASARRSRRVRLQREWLAVDHAEIILVVPTTSTSNLPTGGHVDAATGSNDHVGRIFFGVKVLAKALIFEFAFAAGHAATRFPLEADPSVLPDFGHERFDLVVLGLSEELGEFPISLATRRFGFIEASIAAGALVVEIPALLRPSRLGRRARGPREAVEKAAQER